MFGSKILLIFTLSALLFKPFCLAQEVKEPNAAGSFYPDNPRELSALIEGFLKKADPQSLEGKIFALISPHAGYGYSGLTAAYGYKLVKGKPYRTIIVIGPSHQFAFSGVSVYPKGAFKTPLGEIKIDEQFTRKLLLKSEEIIFDPAAFEKEHSVEVQLPFLQRVIPGGFRIVPIVMGDCSLSVCLKLAEAIREAVGKRDDILVIASTDMYHGYDFEEGDKIDNRTLAYLKNMDAQGLYYGLREQTFQLCGGFPVVTAILLAKESGHNKLEVLRHTNSAEATGRMIKKIWTVGYASCAIDKAKGDEIMLLDREKRKKVLGIARNSMENYLETGKKLEVKESDPDLNKEFGAFVTIRKNGELRGCIGDIIGRKPLYETIRDLAIESSTADPRFPALRQGELKEIEIEISLLSPLERVDSADNIQLGAHGVIVKKGSRSGVFLPQVAEETGWGKEEFLSNLCLHKAGLPADCWKDKSTELYIFTAEVFSEKNY